MIHKSRSIDAADLTLVVEQARTDLAALRGASVLITGAGGFIGSWLVETAAHANRTADARLRIFALLPPDFDVASRAPHLIGLDGVTLLQGDICTMDRDSLARQNQGVASLDAVIHAAIAVDAKTIAANPIPTLDTAVEGTRRTLELARESGASRFLFLSSGAVYGSAPPHLERIPESFVGGPDQTNPRQVYAEGKRIGEMMCACVTRAYGMATIMARAFAFVGPHLPIDRHFAVGNFMRDALFGGPVVVNGDGTPLRSYMYAADLATWLWALLVRGEPGRAYNVGAEREIDIAALAHLVASFAEPPCGVDIRGRAVVGASPERYLPDVRLARETLGLTEQVTLEEGIARTMRWHR